MKTLFGLAVVCALSIHSIALACAAFQLSNSATTVVGKNFDMQSGNGLIVVNKRNLKKTALSKVNPQTWVSKYGSVTFNWISRELPQGGMNEAGLVVEVLMLHSAQFPDPQGSSSPTVSELQWAQYQLDNYATTAEVLAHANDLLIKQIAAPVHYFVCDSSGQCLTFDPIAGQYVIHSGSSLPINLLTNSTYADSAKSAEQYDSPQSCSQVPNDYNSIDRFDRLACTLASKPSRMDDVVSLAFSDLASVKGVTGQGGAQVGDQTQWSIVYDVSHKTISLTTNASPSRKIFAFKDFDFSCSKPTQVLDVNDSGTGDVGGRFVDYTDKIDQDNLQLTQAVFPQLPAALIPGIVAAAGRATCQEQASQ